MNHHDHYYKLVDRPTLEELEALGINCCFDVSRAIASPFTPGKLGIVGVGTCTNRPPIVNEWYLSGAIPGVYKAGGNFRGRYDIARLVVIKTELKVVEISKYRVEELSNA